MLSQADKMPNPDAAAPMAPADDCADAAIERARADLYTLFSVTLGAAPTAAVLAALSGLEGDATLLGRACAELAGAARATTPEDAARAHFDLFIGVGRGELLPYASYYLTGFLNERPLAAVRADMAALGLARAEGLHDPEDHIAILCAVMAQLAAEGRAAQARFFTERLRPWAGRFFDDLAAARPVGLHHALGVAGAAFMAVETQAFSLET